MSALFMVATLTRLFLGRCPFSPVWGADGFVVSGVEVGLQPGYRVLLEFRKLLRDIGVAALILYVFGQQFVEAFDRQSELLRGILNHPCSLGRERLEEMKRLAQKRPRH